MVVGEAFESAFDVHELVAESLEAFEVAAEDVLRLLAVDELEEDLVESVERLGEVVGCGLDFFVDEVILFHQFNGAFGIGVGDGLHDRGHHGDVQRDRGGLALFELDQRRCQRDVIGDTLRRRVPRY